MIRRRQLPASQCSTHPKCHKIMTGKFMKLFATLGLTFLLSISGAHAQGPAKSTKPPQPVEKTRSTKILLQQNGKDLATIECRGDVTFESPCHFDAASNTFIFALPDGNMVVASDGCLVDSDKGITTFPGKVTFGLGSEKKSEKNILTAQDATMQFPPTNR
jgi:hypothetical protein